MDIFTGSQQTLAQDGLNRVRESGYAGPVWFVGHWGFGYYARKAGMSPVVPAESVLQAGQWVLVPDQVDQQPVVFDPQLFALRQVLDSGAVPPLSTVPEFYIGESPFGFARRPHQRLYLMQVRSTHRAFLGLDLPTLSAYVRKRSTPSVVARATPILAGYLQSESSANRLLALQTLALLGPGAVAARPAVALLMNDADPAVRSEAERTHRAFDGRPDRTGGQ